jgi:hypothetical protein
MKELSDAEVGLGVLTDAEVGLGVSGAGGSTGAELTDAEVGLESPRTPKYRAFATVEEALDQGLRPAERFFVPNVGLLEGGPEGEAPKLVFPQWAATAGRKPGDIVVSPDGSRAFRIGADNESLVDAGAEVVRFPKPQWEIEEERQAKKDELARLRARPEATTRSEFLSELEAKPLQVAAGAMGAIASPVAAALELGAYPAGWISPKASEMMRGTAQQISETTRQISEPIPSRQNRDQRGEPLVGDWQFDWGRAAAEGLGQVAGIIGTSGVGAMAQLPRAATQAVQIGQMFGMEFTDAMQRARDEGREGADALARALGSAAFSTAVEHRLGTGRIARALFPSKEITIRNLTAAGIPVQAAKNFAAGYGEEWLQRVGQNLIVGRPQSLDDVFEGANEEGVVGGILQSAILLPAAGARTAKAQGEKPPVGGRPFSDAVAAEGGASDVVNLPPLAQPSEQEAIEADPEKKYALDQQYLAQIKSGLPSEFTAVRREKDSPLNNIEKALGIRIVEVEDKAGQFMFNGFYIHGTRTVLLNRNSPHWAESVVAHEAMHLLQKTDPQSYSAIADEVLALMSQDALRRAVEQKKAVYAAAMSRNLSDSEAMIEVANDFIGDAVRSTRALERLAGKKPGVFTKLGRAIVSVIEKVLEAIGYDVVETAGPRGYGTEKLFADVARLKKARAAVLKALEMVASSPAGADPGAVATPARATAAASVTTAKPPIQRAVDAVELSGSEWYAAVSGGETGKPLTALAFEAGRQARSIEDVAALIRGAAHFEENAAAHKKQAMARFAAGDRAAMDDMLQGSMKGQFYREALEAATGYSDLIGKSRPEGPIPFDWRQHDEVRQLLRNNAGVLRIPDTALADASIDASKLVSVITQNPDGFTVDPSTGEPVTSGFVVAPSKKTEVRLRPDEITEENVARYLDRFRSVFESYPERAFFGGRKNPDDGLFYLDIVFVFDSVKDALYAAKNGQQIAIFDLSGLRTIKTDEGIAGLRESGDWSDAERPELRRLQEELDRSVESAWRLEASVEEDELYDDWLRGKREQEAAARDARRALRAQKAYEHSGGQGDGVTLYGNEREKAPGEMRGGRLRLRHWSVRELDEVDPAQYGTYAAGEEKKRRKRDPELWLNRSYWGTPEYVREPQLAQAVNPHDVVVPARFLYDYHNDPDDFYTEAALILTQNGYAKFDEQARISIMEALIYRSGYIGYFSRNVLPGAAAIFYKLPVGREWTHAEMERFVRRNISRRPTRKRLARIRRQWDWADASVEKNPAEIRAFADRLAAMTDEQRDNVPFDENYDGWVLYEARRLMPKTPNTERLTRLTERNSMVALERYDYIANINGEPYGVSEFDDPDSDDEGAYVLAYEPVANPSGMVETDTSDFAELVRLAAGLGASASVTQIDAAAKKILSRKAASKRTALDILGAVRVEKIKPTHVFESRSELVAYVENRFGRVADALKTQIWPTTGYTAQYIVDESGFGGVIEYNPFEMVDESYTRAQVDAVMTEELIHAASGAVLASKKIKWTDFYADLGRSLSPAQRRSLRAVYTSLRNDVDYGAEFLRVGIQKLLYGTITEAEIKTTAFKKILALLRDVLDFFRSKRTKPEFREVYNATERLMRKADRAAGVRVEASAEVGKSLGEARDSLPVLRPPAMPSWNRDSEAALRKAASEAVAGFYGKTYVAPDGVRVTMRNPKWSDAVSLYRHITRNNDGTGDFNRSKAASALLVPWTIQNAQLRIYDHRRGTRAYVARIGPRDWHLVFVDDGKNRPYSREWGSDATDVRLETQFVVNPGQVQDFFAVEWAQGEGGSQAAASPSPREVTLPAPRAGQRGQNAQSGGASQVPPPASLAEALADGSVTSIEEGARKLVAQNAVVIGPASFSITAFHGTPHRIAGEQFDTRRIGTGEGAQVFGWGLYFAQNPNVAERYRQTGYASVLLDGRPLTEFKRFQALAEDDKREVGNILSEVADEGGDTGWLFGYAARRGGNYAVAYSLMKARRRVKSVTRAEGNLYRVAMDAELDDFLSFHAPLEAQSEKVRAALSDVVGSIPDTNSGSQIYTALARAASYRNKVTTDGEFSDPRGASEWLLERGVKGIWYYDAFSRGGGRERTRNFVVFSDKLVRITEINGQTIIPFAHASVEYSSSLSGKKRQPTRSKFTLGDITKDSAKAWAKEADEWLANNAGWNYEMGGDIESAIRAVNDPTTPLDPGTREFVIVRLIEEANRRATSARNAMEAASAYAVLDRLRELSTRSGAEQGKGLVARKLAFHRISYLLPVLAWRGIVRQAWAKKFKLADDSSPETDVPRVIRASGKRASVRVADAVDEAAGIDGAERNRRGINRRAEAVIAEMAKTQKDTPEFEGGGARDALREAVRKKIAGEISDEEFVMQVVGMGVSPANADKLLKVSLREAHARALVEAGRKLVAEAARPTMDAEAIIAQMAKSQSDTPDFSPSQRSEVRAAVNAYLAGDLTDAELEATLDAIGVSEGAAQRLVSVARREAEIRAAREWVRERERTARALKPERIRAILNKVAKTQDIEWADLFMDSDRATQAERRMFLLDAIRARPEFARLTPDEAADLERLLSSAWEQARIDVFRKEFAKYVGLPRVEKAEQTMDELLPELIRQANLGTLDDTAFLNAIAAKFGLPTLSGEVARKLTELSQRAQKAPEGVLRNKVLQQMVDAIQSSGQVNPFDLARDVWYANALSGLRTQTAVLAGSWIHAAIMAAQQAMDIGVVERDPKTALRIVQAFFLDTIEGVANGIDVMVSGDYTRRPEFAENTANVLSGRGRMDTLEWMKKHGTAWGKLVGQLAYARRAIVALDYVGATAARGSGQIYNAALAGPEQLQIALRRFDREQARAAWAQAKTELQAAGRAKLVDIRARQLEILVEGIDREITQRADVLGQVAALNATPVGFGGYVYSMLESLANIISRMGDVSPEAARGAAFAIKAGAGLAFARAAINMTQNASNWMPIVGGVNYARALMGKKLPPGHWARMFAVLDENGEPLSDDRRRLILAAQFSALALGALAYALARASGGDDEDKERAFDVTGSWKGYTPQQRRDMMAAGMRPLSVKVGGRWWRYESFPFAGVLAVVGNIRDRERRDGAPMSSDNALQMLADGWAEGLFYMKDISVLSGLSQMLGLSAIKQNEDAAAINRAMAQLSRVVVTGVVPFASLVREVDSYFDPATYKPKSALDHWITNIPFVRRWTGAGPEYNMAGLPVENALTPISRLSGKPPEDPLAVALGALVERGVFPPHPGGASISWVKDGVRVRGSEIPEVAYKYDVEVLKEWRKIMLPMADRIAGMSKPEFEWFASERLKPAAAKIRTKIQSQIAPGYLDSKGRPSPYYRINAQAASR